VPPLADGILAALSSSDLFSLVSPVASLPLTLDLRPGGRVLQGPPHAARLAAMPRDSAASLCGARLLEGRFPDEASAEPEVLASVSLFGTRVPQPPLGTALPMTLARGVATATIVGFFDGTAAVADFPTLYANPAAIAAVEAKSPPAAFARPSLALLSLAPGRTAAEAEAFLRSLPGGDAVSFSSVAQVAERFRNDTTRNLLRSLPLSLTLSVLTAVFMLFAVLSTGLAARRRQLAALRSLGMTRGGAAKTLAAETLLLVVPGWLAGLAAGCALLQAFLWFEPGKDLPRVLHLGWETPLATAALALVAGACAVVRPARLASRVQPLEMFAAAVPPENRIRPGRILLALALLAPLPLVAACGTRLGAFALHAGMLGVGIPCAVAGLVLAAPALLRAGELLFVPPVAAALSLDKRLLARRLSRDPARVLGTLAAMALGLGAYIAIHIWGGTLMASYMPSAEWPDAICSFLPGGVDRAAAETLGTLGAFASPPLPIESTQFPFAEETKEAIAARGATLPEGVVLLFGADPGKAFAGGKPFAPFRFTEGDRESAARALAAGDAAIVPAMFARLTGLHLGDTFSLGGKTLRIAGVVELNWHMVTSRALVRTRFGRYAEAPQPRGPRGGGRPDAPAAGGPRGGRTIAMAFVSEALVREMSGNADRTYFLWLRYGDALRKENPLAAAVASDRILSEALAPGDGCAVATHARDEIADGTLAHGNDILGSMARIPFWSLAITTAGMFFLLLSSARATRHELSALRAAGMTRGQLRRLLFGEAVVLALCALAASLAGGLLIGWSFTAWTRLGMAAGLPVTLAVPAGKIAEGLLFAFALASAFAALALRRAARLVPATPADVG
ncbi:MAG: ABC transporter permease, partial [Kiritimatiellae bacterium]|nr:ABC transporter permease [Kiritimatiellia bacterium]